MAVVSVPATVRLNASCEMGSSESCNFSPESAILEKTVLPDEARALRMEISLMARSRSKTAKACWRDRMGGGRG
jgi:hypothetical protein